jgi:adhesin transport system outer membrane protein
MMSCSRSLVVYLVLSCLFFLPVSGSAESDMTVLKESVVRTLKSNPRLDVLKYNREAVKKDLRKAQGGYYPSLDARVGFGTDVHSDAVSRGGDYDHDWDKREEYSLILRQLLWDGWETRSFVGVSETKLQSVTHRVFDNAESLALDAVIAYLDVYRQRELVRFAEENVQAHSRILGSLKERQELGAGSVADVRQTQGRLSRARASLTQAQSGLQVAEANYRRVVGSAPPADLVLPVKPVGYVPDSLEEALKSGRAGNPKLAAAAADIETARQNMELSRAKMYPRFYAELSTSYDDGVESSKTWEHNTAAMLRMDWNLFNGGSDTAEREAAMYRVRQTKADRNELMRMVDEEIEATWSRYETAISKISNYGDALKYNRETLSMYMDQFTVGQRSLLDVLDAENELFQTSGLLVTAQANEVIAAFRILALGGKMTESLGVDPALYTDPANKIM